MQQLSHLLSKAHGGLSQVQTQKEKAREKEGGTER